MFMTHTLDERHEAQDKKNGEPTAEPIATGQDESIAALKERIKTRVAEILGHRGNRFIEFLEPVPCIDSEGTKSSLNRMSYLHNDVRFWNGEYKDIPFDTVERAVIRCVLQNLENGHFEIYEETNIAELNPVFSADGIDRQWLQMRRNLEAALLEITWQLMETEHANRIQLGDAIGLDRIFGTVRYLQCRPGSAKIGQKASSVLQIGITQAPRALRNVSSADLTITELYQLYSKLRQIKSNNGKGAKFSYEDQ